MKKRIILIGEANSTNLGDQVICKLSQYLFKKQWYDCNIEMFDISCARYSWLSRGISKFCSLIQNDLLYRKYNYWYVYSTFLKKVTNDTLVIFVGGQMFMDFFIEAILAILRVVKIRNLEVRFHSCGTSSLLSMKNRSRLIKALHETKCNYLTLRDGVDLFSSTIFSQAKFVPDIAICSDLMYGEAKLPRKKIGWGCIDVQLYNKQHKELSIKIVKYISDSVSSIDSLIQKGYIVELFTNGNVSDYRVACLIQENLSQRNRQVLLADRPKEDTQLVDIIKQYDCVVASRLHALILSYSFDIPCFGLSWDKKIEEFFFYIGHSDRVMDMLKMSEINWDIVIEKLKREGLNKTIKKDLQLAVLSQIKNI